ncbi:MAG TPA: UDP-N-acetylmuramoyl-L-alanine--D-glutamate ligase [Clostridiales bacterium]|nr:MAG: UDP-N-acetylmuramoylalanine--D-glutamate ligase [Clostridiales bacterium GWD2_32_59]HAN10422.1 UDP-N-acetylmuramoyl-L-alanine--D-glutamate ligase [Clostridiales bacterium]
MNNIYDEIKNKKILILGFGREGRSTYNFIRKELKAIHLGIADKNEDVKNDELIKLDENITFHLGADYLKCIEDYDMVIKSPGIILEGVNDIENITSQTDLFLKQYSKNIIGVTGTKGKTTIVTLLTHIFKNAGLDVVLVGNVGIPAFDQIDNIEEDTVIVYELSSFQLEYINNSPHIAIMLNMFKDHLSNHGTLENYQKAKFNIVRHQNDNDIFIFNKDNEVVNGFANNINVKSKKLSISQRTAQGVDVCILKDYITYNGEQIYNLSGQRNLIGDHNIYNIMAVILVCKLLNISNENIENSIKSYKPEPHRLEYVGTYGEIRFYNDSQATIPEPTMEGIKALKNVDTLIVGGYDKGVDYKGIADFLIESDVKNILCIYDTGKKIYDMTYNRNENQNVIYLTGLEEAVSIAKKMTEKGKTCLMSPASASFGAFKDYKERGEKFKELVARG